MTPFPIYLFKTNIVTAYVAFDKSAYYNFLIENVIICITAMHLLSKHSQTHFMDPENVFCISKNYFIKSI